MDRTPGLLETTAALMALAEAGIPTDIQELLIHGDPSRGIPPGALKAALKASSGVIREDTAMRVFYTNWRGETSVRTITPIHVWHGATDWHPEPQWLLRVWDHDKNAMRDFALKDFRGPSE